MKTVYMVLALMLVMGLTEAQEWSYQNPIPTESVLRGLAMISPNEAWLTGGSGALHTIDAGLTWEHHTLNTSCTLTGISFVNAQTGWVAGYTWSWPADVSSAILCTMDGGLTWFSQYESDSVALLGVCFVTPDSGWATGLRMDAGGSAHALLLATIDGGQTWQAQVEDAQPLRGLGKLVFCDRLNGWVLGASVSDSHGMYAAARILRTVDGGATWTMQLSGDEVVTDAAMVNPAVGWLTTHQFIEDSTGIHFRAWLKRTLNGGESWVPRLELENTYLLHISFTDEDHGWYAQTSASPAGVIVNHTTDGGETWTLSAILDSESECRYFHITSPGSGWLLTHPNTIYHTADWGDTWIPASHSVAGQELRAAWIADSATIWAVGGTDSESAVVRSINGGTSWEAVVIGYELSLKSVTFSTAQAGWAVGGMYGNILHTVDGGGSWVQQYTDMIGLYDVTCLAGTGFAWATGSGSNGGLVLTTNNGGAQWTPHSAETDGTPATITFIDSSRGWIAGRGWYDQTQVYGLILASNDGGVTWQEQESNTHLPLHDILFLSLTHGWAVGDSGCILTTQDAGTTWTLVNQPTDHALRSIAIPESNHLWAAGDHGVIVHSNDGGNTWTLQTSHTTADLNAVVFRGIDDGWAFGASGVILKYGGGTWTRPRPEIPADISLEAYPNPFNSATRLSYDVPVNGHVTLVVFDITGRLVETLEDRVMPAGKHIHVFDGTGRASGVYFVRLKAQGAAVTEKLLLLK